jgi:hypothetical protein
MATDVLVDPLASALARLLTMPLQQLYALLWRAGVVEIVPNCQAKPAVSA